MNNWRSSEQMDYYYRELDGRILGSVWHYVGNHTVWASKILVEEFPFTDSSEKYLGKFISQEHARRSVELYWDRESRTLLER